MTTVMIIPPSKITCHCTLEIQVRVEGNMTVLTFTSSYNVRKRNYLFSLSN